MRCNTLITEINIQKVVLKSKISIFWHNHKVIFNLRRMELTYSVMDKLWNRITFSIFRGKKTNFQRNSLKLSSWTEFLDTRTWVWDSMGQKSVLTQDGIPLSKIEKRYLLRNIFNSHPCWFHPFSLKLLLWICQSFSCWKKIFLCELLQLKYFN